MTDRLPIPPTLAGKRALVTGASQGLGQDMAVTFAQAGATVAIHGRTLGETEATIELVRNLGANAHAVAADFLEPASIRPMVEGAIKAMGGLDILVNNAGIGEISTLEDMDEALWDRTIAINQKAPFLVTKVAVETMRSNADGGRILFISSTAAKTADAGFSVYATAKAGLLAFARCIAPELGPHGITVNAICPGWIDTALSRDPVKAMAEELKVPFDQVWQMTMADTNMMKAFLKPADISQAALFLVGPGARHITAQSLNVCAGLAYWG
ncbi:MULTISPECIES: SDR family NAD(P)-dependent oxidoreductase [Mesorhizobium]|uniref:NAD(P)-dependent dehydrogenase (Short-subunit alcohol dehydrogenase family) n=1 Tax=Mesorhizobium robiniae TaxID=559315 RepID=A0ABV2GXG2_9HYPH|nr:SDR family NAD(P)-dependent oxidoreductase [Mesorhizobium amorphae]